MHIILQIISNQSHHKNFIYICLSIFAIRNSEARFSMRNM